MKTANKLPLLLLTVHRHLNKSPPFHGGWGGCGGEGGRAKISVVSAVQW